ncbi:MAG: glycosyltransferase [Bacteroidaceae bacterium]|nr:glycosyltransferase [Bacteroidaceae bacterium]
MEPTFKIVIINHSFQVNYFSRRWKIFAEKHPNVDVTLFAHDKHEWYGAKSNTFGQAYTLRAKEADDGNFHIRSIRIRNNKLWGWTSPDLKPLFLEIKPDVIYNIGDHNMASIRQMLTLRNKYLPQTKFISFSMRGPQQNIRIKKSKCSPVRWVARRLLYLYQRRNMPFVNRHVDAFFCHYPKAVECFRLEGYNGPIYMQTQVGVNEEWFHEDLEARKEIRDKYGIADTTYVFGSATRFTTDKGVDIILKALPKEGDWKYLMMGAGSNEQCERLRNLIRERGLQNKVIETGFIDWYDMTKYWNAVDCAIHVPLTTDHWEETFSLAAIQPQITRKPVIGDTSGSVPYQIGFSEMIVPEGDVEALHEKMLWVLNHKEEAKVIGERMYQRTHNSFEIQHLNDLFYDTLVEDVLPGKFDKRKTDMTKYETA